MLEIKKFWEYTRVTIYAIITLPFLMLSVLGTSFLISFIGEKYDILNYFDSLI